MPEQDTSATILNGIQQAVQGLASSNPQDAIDEILVALGTSMNVSRTYIFQKKNDVLGKVMVSMIYEWTAEGVKEQLPMKAMHNVPIELVGFSRWVKHLSNNQEVQGTIDDVPKSELPVYIAGDAKSIIALPIFIQDKWWGLLGIDDNVHKKIWNKDEINALNIAVKLVAVALASVSNRAEEDIQESFSIDDKMAEVLQTLKEEQAKK